VERKRLNNEFGYGLTLYGWDGDTLAYETSWEKRTTTHYVYEPGSFTPLMQATGAAVLDDRTSAPPAFGAVAYYHCDQIGTPQELSDADGAIAWSAYYRAWGEAKEVIGDAARKAGISNPLRFAGQYFDHETGLHYNRYRYYDPHSGRFISKDPIGLAGGINVYAYAPNPVGWIDPLGLTPNTLDWSIVSKKGECRCTHVNKHGVNDLQKKDHGVFYGDPTSKINDVWNSKGNIQPINDGSVDIYHIPSQNSGYAGGYAGQGQNLNYVTVVTQAGTNKIITGYPSAGN
uniref:RHS repeat-associated core domain-containing protein n=1 Tax=Paraburkholderia sp. BCC1885 TaxID=2562669 RepID=UPI0011842636